MVAGWVLGGGKTRWQHGVLGGGSTVCWVSVAQGGQW